MKEEIPFLSVKTVDNVTYTESIECPVVEVQDDSMYQGESKVLDAGVPGEQIVNADIAYLNGVEQERTVLSTQVTREATLLAAQRLLYLARIRAHYLLLRLPLHLWLLQLPRRH